MSGPVLEALAVGHSFAGCPVLAAVSLRASPGEWVGILGPNGAGKSTLLRVLAGLIVPSSGTVRLADLDPARANPRQVARLRAFLPQQSETVFPFTALELALLGRHPHGGRFSLESAADFEKARAALAEVDCLPFANRTLDTLSGGERQRVCLARALSQEAPVLLLDEPTTALDLFHRSRILSVLERRRREGSTIVMSTHDLHLAGRRCDRLLLLSEGKTVVEGTPHEVLTREHVEAAFRVPVTVETRAGAPYVFEPEDAT
jgi:iron complex transport system ATP-binding protein